MGVKAWGIVLLLIGLGMIVFNKPYAAWTAPLVPMRFNSPLVPRIFVVVVGLTFVGGGVALLIAPPR